MAEEGFAHGRFQLVHLEHEEYLRDVSSACDFMWLGITQPEISNLVHAHGAATHRSDNLANPLTFWERAVLLGAVLQDSIGRPPDSFRIVPFPIERPAVLTQYIPSRVEAFTTICEPWNEQKIRVLQDAGYRVTVLIERETKKYESSTIRRLIRDGSDGWQSMVSSTALRVMSQLEVTDRLRSSNLE